MNFEPTTSLSIPFLERERELGGGGEAQFELEIISLIEDIVLNSAKKYLSSFVANTNLLGSKYLFRSELFSIVTNR